MSYDSRLLGTLWIEPFPAAEDMPALREGLAALRTAGSGRLVLTPMGHGLSFEDTFDWEEALAIVERASKDVFAPRGLALGGELRAMGEDDAHLATVTVGAGGVRVEHHEDDDDEDAGSDGEDER